MKLFILLPAYNEAEALLPLFKRVKAMVDDLDVDYDVIVYNDGSTDNTLDILTENKYGLSLAIIGKQQNKGLGIAFQELLKEVVARSSGEDDIVIVFDSDNTHNPAHVFHMINKIRDGFDVVIASRYRSDSRVVGLSQFRQFLSLAASWIMRVIFPIKGVKDYTCGYRAYSIEIINKAFEQYGDGLIEETGFACMAELLIKLRALKVLAVEIPIILRYDKKGGESKMKILQTIKRTILMMLKLKKVTSRIKNQV